ncbi:MAG: hypothetical protein P4L79_09495 [Legionella sp.]|uniref:hypothetical protein n=1 Tax=Legionella sp. TaxID=459 RepID=UPI0028468E99|nr:hypothetical protein [Legionella sp.]
MTTVVGDFNAKFDAPLASQRLVDSYVEELYQNAISGKNAGTFIGENILAPTADSLLKETSESVVPSSIFDFVNTPNK